MNAVLIKNTGTPAEHESEFVADDNIGKLYAIVPSYFLARRPSAFL